MPIRRSWFRVWGCSLTVCILAPALASAAAWAGAPPLHGLDEVNHERVELRGGFWGPRLKTHHEVTVPHSLDCLEKDWHVINFDKASGVAKGPPSGHAAFDSDLHKALEGAMYSLRHHDDAPLLRRVDGILDRILAAQQKDGFLISYFIIRQSDQRWEDLRLLLCGGFPPRIPPSLLVLVPPIPEVAGNPRVSKTGPSEVLQRALSWRLKRAK